MNPEAQRIAIAEACGWKFYCTNTLGAKVWHHKDGRAAGIDSVNSDKQLPDYLNDLNAMHEAEKVLDEREADIYARTLGQIVECGWADFGAKMVMATTKVVSATAAQRAEAFLRTIGKWKNE